MRSAASLPPIVSPQVVFEELMVEWAKDIFSPPPQIEEAKFSVQIEVEGAANSPWTLTFDLGDYRVQRGKTTLPFLTVQGREEHWHLTWGRWIKDLAVEIEKAGGPEPFLEKLQQEAKQRKHTNVVLTDEKLAALRNHPTFFACRVPHFEGHNLSMNVGIFCQNFAQPPHFVLEMDGETLQALRKRTLDPIAAWKQKKIQFQGDLVHATKLAKIFGSTD